MRKKEDILREEGKVRLMGGCAMETERETEVGKELGGAGDMA